GRSWLYRHLDRTGRLVGSGAEPAVDPGERYAVRDDRAPEHGRVAREEVLHDLEVGAGAGAVVDEGAFDGELLGEHEQRWEHRHLRVRAEHADRAAGAAGEDRLIEGVGLAADRLDDDVDRRGLDRLRGPLRLALV